jgi:hypothetical protein
MAISSLGACGFIKTRPRFGRGRFFCTCRIQCPNLSLEGSRMSVELAELGGALIVVPMLRDDEVR